MCTSDASAGAATQRTPSASRLAATYDLNFIAVPFLGMSPQALGNLPRSGRTGIVTSRHGELSADVSDRPYSGPQCAALAASSEGSNTRPLSITFAIPA